MSNLSTTESAAEAVDGVRELWRSDGLALRGKSLLSMRDLSRDQLMGLLDTARALQAASAARTPSLLFSYPAALALIFEKPSLRTRVTFDLGMQQLGGHTVVLGPAEIGLGTRETVPDTARNLERWVSAIMARVFSHHALVELRDNCGIPIINGLSDLEHPCQALADLYAIRQRFGGFDGLKIAYIGDGNNVLHSLMLGAAMCGMCIAAACPRGYEPHESIVQAAQELAARPEAVAITSAPLEAAAGAHVVYTDVWTSMGQEKEQLARLQAFRSFQVNARVMAAAHAEAVFMHCLPAHRSDEVTDDVMDGPQSIVFDQAEARLHAQKAVLAMLIGPNG